MRGAVHAPTEQYSGLSVPLIDTSEAPASLPAEVLMALDEPKFGPYLPGLEPSSTTFRFFRKVLDYRHYRLHHKIGVPTEQVLSNMFKTKKNIDDLNTS